MKGTEDCIKTTLVPHLDQLKLVYLKVLPIKGGGYLADVLLEKVFPNK